MMLYKLSDLIEKYMVDPFNKYIFRPFMGFFTTPFGMYVLIFMIVLAAMLGNQSVDDQQQIDIKKIQQKVSALETRIDELEEEINHIKAVQEIRMNTEEPIITAISKEETVFEEPIYEEVVACSLTATFKSYMDYRMITDTSSNQWALQQEAYTGEDGIRYVGDRMMVAMAGYDVGTKIDITFDDGDVIAVIIGDVKAGTDCSHPDGSILEFIVDTDLMDTYVRMMGNYDVIFDGTMEGMRIHG